VFKFWQAGVWGDPLGPEAINTFLDLARFPHMGRASRPGGPDRSTAEQNVGKLLQGTQAVTIPIFEWYDHALHLMVLDRFLKSPEYLKTPPETMGEMVLFRNRLLSAAQEAALMGAARQLAVQGPVQTAAAGQAAQVAQIAGPAGASQPSAEAVA
jgi:hypothetical protein